MENTIITTFEQFEFSPGLMRGLKKMGFITPSPVQSAAITPMMEKQDLLVQAPTGTGKTAAFGIPAVENTDADSFRIQTMILCPTRELAVQITSVLKQLVSCKPGVRVLALYGGEPIQRQISALRKKPQIIVATPGRMIDHIKRRTVRLKHVNCVVLDEADRMLDMGFRDDIHTILEGVPAERQTVLFSATLSNEIKKLAAAYQVEPQQIQIEQETQTVDRVKQYYVEVRQNMKLPSLLQLLKERQFGLSLVFVATKAMADRLSGELTTAGYPAEALHGDLRQTQRDKVMQRYRSGRVRILVATDVAARGIDVSGIDAVVNYDIPEESDSYVHRIGRTGRAGSSGVAFTFIYRREMHKLQNIIKNTKASIEPLVFDGLSETRPFKKKENQGPKHYAPYSSANKRNGKSRNRNRYVQHA